MTDNLYQRVHDEARHDYFDNRPEPDLPTNAELEDEAKGQDSDHQTQRLNADLDKRPDVR